MAKTIKHPVASQEWREKLRSCSMKIGFHLSLTRPMLEYLCATADDVHWDRMLYFQSGNPATPDNSMASRLALEKRGMIQRKPVETIEAEKHNERPFCEWASDELTPAGKCIVELLKMAGLFVEADASINKKNRA